MTDPLPTDDSILSSEFNSCAKDLLQQLLDYTLEQMMAYRHGHPATPSKIAFAAQSFALFRDNDFDALAVAGAIGSAITEFERTLDTVDAGEFDRTQLCARLVRLAYNRMQRRRRADQKLAQAVARSEKLDNGDPFSKIDREISHFREHIGEVVDIVLGRMPETERQAILLRLNGSTQVAVAKQLGISRAAVQRIERRFADIASRTLEH